MLAAAFSPALLLAGLGSCGLFSEDDTGLSSIDELVSRVESVYVQSELAKERVDAAIERLKTIASSDFPDDPVAAYKEYVAAVERAERQAQRLRNSVEPMKEAAASVFERWSTDLEAFSSEGMKQRSSERLALTRERYDAIVSTVDPAQEVFERFNKILRDHALFLSHDFNVDSVTAIKDDVRSLSQLAEELEDRFDDCLEAARAYIDMSAPPLRAKASPGSR